MYFCAFYIKYKTQNSRELTFVVEPMLGILCKHSFCDFVTAKVSSLPLLKITTKSTHFLPAKKKITLLWIELQNLSSKHRAVKNLQIAKTFQKI